MNYTSVSELTSYLKSIFEGDAALKDLWLAGEVSNFKQAASGHCYLTLKDATSSIRAVIWRTQAVRMVLPRDGDAVLVHGYVSVYEPRGDYQLYVDALQPSGIGLLWQQYQRLKDRLEAEGLFAAGRKRPIPEMPARVGIVTSTGAAALRDILRTLATRYPLVDVVLSPAPVQGEQAPLGIIAALDALNRWSVEREPVEVIILARGGGSIEELWAFNDERVARAIAGSRIPVISGVGHETDFTIADFVADWRAATPTAAAAAAVPDMRVLARRVAVLLGAAETLTQNRLAGARSGVAGLSNRLERLSPARKLVQDRQRLDDLSRRATLAIDHILRRWSERLANQRRHLAALDPAGVLARGYALVTAPDGRAITSRVQATPGLRVRVRVVDGAFGATVGEGIEPGNVAGQ